MRQTGKKKKKGKLPSTLAAPSCTTHTHTSHTPPTYAGCQEEDERDKERRFAKKKKKKKKRAIPLSRLRNGFFFCLAEPTHLGVVPVPSGRCATPGKSSTLKLRHNGLGPARLEVLTPSSLVLSRKMKEKKTGFSDQPFCQLALPPPWAPRHCMYVQPLATLLHRPR